MSTYIIRPLITSRRCIRISGHHGDCDMNDFDPCVVEDVRCVKRLYLTNNDRRVTASEFWDA